MSRVCFHCNSEVPKEAFYCPSCGSELNSLDPEVASAVEFGAKASRVGFSVGCALLMLSTFLAVFTGVLAFCDSIPGMSGQAKAMPNWGIPVFKWIVIGLGVMWLGIGVLWLLKRQAKR